MVRAFERIGTSVPIRTEYHTAFRYVFCLWIYIGTSTKGSLSLYDRLYNRVPYFIPTKHGYGGSLVGDDLQGTQV